MQTYVAFWENYPGGIFFLNSSTIVFLSFVFFNLFMLQL